MLFSNRCMCQRRGQGTPDPQTFSSSHISSDCCCCYELCSLPSHESSGCCCLNGSGPAESSKETSVPSSKVKLQSVVSNYQLTQKTHQLDLSSLQSKIEQEKSKTHQPHPTLPHTPKPHQTLHASTPFNPKPNINSALHLVQLAPNPRNLTRKIHLIAQHLSNRRIRA